MYKYRAKALDLVQTVSMEQVKPIMYCYMMTDGRINVDQLKKAVMATAKTIPEILCLYQPKDHSWYKAWNSAEPLVIEAKGEEAELNLIWNLTVGPQFKIFIRHLEHQDQIIAAMSHILADGAGFQQYLSLLKDCYNDSKVPWKDNTRDWWEIFHETDAAVRKRTKRNYQTDSFLLPKDKDAESVRPAAISVSLSREQTTMLMEQVKQMGVTVNDYLMAAYASIIFTRAIHDDIVLPVPADLREYCMMDDFWTIANMTGKYQCKIPFGKAKSTAELALIIHKRMKALKAQKACIRKLPLLNALIHKIPLQVLRKIISWNYHLEPISYTNLGRLKFNMDENSEEKDILLRFGERNVTSCYLCGMYRRAPSFQVAVSTYGQTLTLSANIIGTNKQRAEAEQCLMKIRNILIESLLSK